jgi:hypothetical protein
MNAKLPAGISDGKWVLFLELRSGLYPHPEDQRIQLNKRPCVIERIEGAYLMGVIREEIEIFEAYPAKDEECDPYYWGAVRTEYVWVVSDKPFGALRTIYDALDGKLVECFRAAQQVHMGKLGCKPRLTAKVEVAHSNIDDPEDRDRCYWDERAYEHKMRPARKLNWIRLTDVAKTTGMSCEEILRGFSKFSASTYYEPNVPLIDAAKATDLMGQEGCDFFRYRFYTDTFPQTFCGGELGWGGREIGPTGHVVGDVEQLVFQKAENLWITQSLGLTVGRLAQFGYRPDQEMPTPGFKLEVKVPEAPAREFPVLSVEELRELHELRRNLPAELPKSMFKTAAVNAICNSEHFDGGTWTRDESLDDNSNGFSYYVDFEKITAFNGRLTVGTCYWTRGGADKTPNYWAGFISVMPEPTKELIDGKPKPKPNPRFDKNALLRIWFWPDSLVRVSPTGSRGGLCPPEIEPEIADQVKSFLVNFGYTL